MLSIIATPSPFSTITIKYLLETNQPLFRITKLNTFQYGVFAWITNSQPVSYATPEVKAVFWEGYEYVTEKDSWSLIVEMRN